MNVEIEWNQQKERREKMSEGSEFGKGLTYCLGLFLAHEALKYPGIDDTRIWFNGAADHFFEFQAECAPQQIRERCITFKKKCLEWRLSFDSSEPTVKDKEWALNEAKSILIEIDRHLGIETEKGKWE